MTALVIAPHPDDEILGCGGVIAKRAEAGDDVWVCIMSEGKRPMYSKEFIKEEFRETARSSVGVLLLQIQMVVRATREKITSADVSADLYSTRTR